MCRTLIVEDNPAFRQSLREALAHRFPFMRIAEAADGDAALREIACRRPDLVFTDIRLPGRNGLEVTRAVKSVHDQATVCVITSYDLPEYRKAALACGADGFLVKGQSAEADIAGFVETTLSARPRALLIENNAAFRDLVHDLLAGYWPTMIVAEAEDGADGLDHVARFRPDLVFLDVRLPTVNGLDLVAGIKAGHAGAAVVVLTGYDLPEYREAALLAGADYFLAKDERVVEGLLEIVGMVLAGRAAG